MASGFNKYPSVGIIIPWYGPWPDWIDYFLASCRENPRLTWILVTDQAPPGISPNVLYRRMSLDELASRIEDRLGIKVQIPHPYKLCDLKPAYGYLFENELSDFTFWGYGDLDLVYGRFENFFSPSDFESYDLFSSHDEFVAGHLCLLRNNRQMRELFKHGGSYRQAFISPAYLGFDEQWLNRPLFPGESGIQAGKTSIIRSHLFRYWLSRQRLVKGIYRKARNIFPRTIPDNRAADFSTIVRTLREEKQIRVRYSTLFEDDLRMRKMRVKDWSVTWKDGALTMQHPYVNKDILYFHFMLSKDRKEFVVGKHMQGTGFGISPRGIKPIGL